MSTLPYYDYGQFEYIIRGDGNRSKRYKHWCLLCKKDRGFAYKNKISKEPLCHGCRMKQPNTLAKISANSSKLIHTEESKSKISNSLHNRYKTTPLNRKIAKNLRGRLSQAFRNGYKTGSAVRDLGCSIEELRLYLESKFESGMTWDNYGRDGWHIDHIMPLCNFDLSDAIQCKKACHYTNLQPLWASSNLEKRKYDGTFK